MTNEELLIGFINYLKPHISPTLQVNTKRLAMQYLFDRYSKTVWKVGDKVKIIECFHGHRFSIGSVVEIIDVDSGANGIVLYCDGGEGEGKWHITKDEGIRL